MLILELCFFLEFELQSPEKWTFTSFKLFSELSWLFFEGEGRMGWLREGQPRGVGGLFASFISLHAALWLLFSC